MIEWLYPSSVLPNADTTLRSCFVIMGPPLEPPIECKMRPVAHPKFLILVGDTGRDSLCTWYWFENLITTSTPAPPPEQPRHPDVQPSPSDPWWGATWLDLQVARQSGYFYLQHQVPGSEALNLLLTENTSTPTSVVRGRAGARTGVAARWDKVPPTVWTAASHRHWHLAES